MAAHTRWREANGLVDDSRERGRTPLTALEFALEGLYLMRRLSKDTDGDTIVYGT